MLALGQLCQRRTLSGRARRAAKDACNVAEFRLVVRHVGHRRPIVWLFAQFPYSSTAQLPFFAKLAEQNYKYPHEWRKYKENPDQSQSSAMFKSSFPRRRESSVRARRTRLILWCRTWFPAFAGMTNHTLEVGAAFAEITYRVKR